MLSVNVRRQVFNGSRNITNNNNIFIMTTEQKFDCVFCKETFDDKETLQIHFRKHGDPKFDLSTKVVKNRTQNESTSVPAEKAGEEIEMVGCDVCEEVFPTISKAITHKHKAHPKHDAKYFCPFCGKLFTMKHLLNKHIQSNHNAEEVSVSKDFHCDMCDVTFNVASAMLYHNKFFHRQDTEIPAIGISKKVKLFSQEMLQIYYCSFCGEEFNNKVNLHKHIGDDHCDENHRPSEVLRCPLCEAIFFHLDAYEIHLTFHSSEDIYSEKNELVSQITEFSLETVAPIMESVEEEDLATQPEEDDNNSDVVSNFLQLVMGDQGDNVSMEKVKHKKHKKHKKSKKASITLDEFLNMNKDVFGDGLGDVQGIEEVPTQVVLKKVKGKAQNRNEAKMVNADLAKLKKQGIVIKAKPKFNSHVVNQHTSKAKQLISGNLKNNTNILQKSPNDIISKLLNQGNSQIKIIKKSTSQNLSNEHEGEETVVSDAIDNSGEQDDISDKMENKKDSDGKSNIQETPSVSSTLNVYSKLSDSVNEIRNNPGEEISRSPDFNGKDTSDKLYASESSKTSDPDEESTLVLEKKTNIYDDRFANPGRESLDVKPSDETKPNFSENHFEKKENDDTNLNNEICDNSDKETATNNANKAISVLKHLSHLITVKPLANQNKSNINEEIKSKGYNSEAHDEYSSSKNISSDQKIPLKSFGQITLKTTTPSLSVTSPVIPPDPESDAEFPDDIENNDNLKLEKKNIIEMKELQVKLVPLSQSLCDAYLSKNNYAEESNDFIAKQSSTTKEDKEKNVESPKKTCNLDILKRLSNVTAKPVNITKAVNQQVIVKPHRPFIPQVKSLQSKLISKGIDEEIEVFNIDDSDEETEENTNKNISEAKPSGVPTDVIKNLSRNITVKSSETKTIPNKNIKIQTKTMRADSYSESYTQIKQSKEIQKSINLQNKLKTLGHITVKPNNSAPKLFNEDFDDYEDDQADSGSDSENIGRVKISEINDDYMSDSDLNDVQPNAVVQSPNPSNSENEDNHDDFNDDLSDFESHIKMNTLKKNEIPVLKKPMPNLDNLKNLNKALTIKSLNTKNVEQVSNPASNKELSEDTNKPPHEMALKLYKPNISQNEQPLSNNILQASGSSHQTALNQKVNAASNQVNTLKTVNTVKRFQSQTVIEEITTTVTKTIRTVNSSTNEVMQSTSQNKPKPINRPQKIINKQPGRELQGTPVRHISPTIGTKIRNAVPVARAPNATIVRPSNQLVPVRPPVFSRPRCPTPGTSAVKKVVPPRCSPQKPAIGKLKISPHALNQTTKRPSDEGFAHFACFKKPKDSFIGPQDLPDCGDDESAMQYSSTQSRSEFSTVTKKAKGMVTATQTKSEVSASCQQQVRKGMGTATQMRSEVCMSSHQQLSKLNSMSGLKVVKTSSKQATQVEEKCELSPGKRNTLEAIEKLQRQGLLVKKPRIEEDQGNSFSESDDEFGEK